MTTATATFRAEPLPAVTGLARIATGLVYVLVSGVALAGCAAVLSFEAGHTLLPAHMLLVQQGPHLSGVVVQAEAQVPSRANSYEAQMVVDGETYAAVPIESESVGGGTHRVVFGALVNRPPSVVAILLANE
jgi:hypothetical protein